MGVGTPRPPLPAAAASQADRGDGDVPADTATDLSRHTDFTSFSIPDDGSPLVLDTTKRIAADKNGVLGPNGQTSLLIEYFEGGKPSDNGKTRASVRVRVTPGVKKACASDAVRITELGKDRKPSYTKRIVLDRKRDSNVFEGTDVSQSSSSLSVRPIEVEYLNNSSDLSSDVASRSRYIQPGSDVSSMPPDSLLNHTPVLQSPRVQRSHSHDESSAPYPTFTYLKAPETAQTRNISQDRLAQKVLEKLNRDDASRESQESVGKKAQIKQSRVNDPTQDKIKLKSNRTSLSANDQMGMLSAKDRSPSVSNVSRSSITNPKLLHAVEDAIRRLILPEIEIIKRQQTINQGSHEPSPLAQEAMVTKSETSQDGASTTYRAFVPPATKPFLVLSQNGDSGTALAFDTTGRSKIHRRLSSEAHEQTLGRPESTESRSRRRDESRSERRSSKSTAESQVSERGVRKKKRSGDSSRSDSVKRADYDSQMDSIPALPMRSEITTSDVTRTSLLSAESDDAKTPRPHSREPQEETKINQKTSRNSITSDRPSMQPRSSSAKQASSARTTSGTSSQAQSQTTPQQDHMTTPNRSTSGDQAWHLDSRPEEIDMATSGHAEHQIGPQDRPDTHRGSSRRSSRQSNRQTSSRDILPTQQQVGSPESTEVDDKQEHLNDTTSPRSASSKKVSEFSLGSGLTSPTVQRVTPRPALVKDDMPHSFAEIRGYVNYNFVPDQAAEDFYDNQREMNDQYRSELSHDSRPDSTHESPSHVSQSQDNSSSSKLNTSGVEHFYALGANAQFFHGGDGFESHVASLLEPSVLLEPSAVGSHSGQSGQHDDSDVGYLGSLHNQAQDNAERRRSRQDNASSERWHAIRERARSLSQSPVRAGQQTSAAPDLKSTEREESAEDYWQNEDNEQSPKGRLDGPWTGEPQHQAIVSAPNEQDFRPELAYNRQVPAIGHLELSRPLAVTAHTLSNMDHSYLEKTFPAIPPKHEARDVLAQDQRESQKLESSRGSSKSRSNHSLASNSAKSKHGSPDVMSSNAPTPLSFSKPPPVLFAENKSGRQSGPQQSSRGQPDRNEVDYPIYQEEQSSQSNGSPQSIREGIGSRDVVALMDHLTIRDSQRNARDTELLVTLVRTAAEMRNSFFDMKDFIEAQNQVNMKNTDAGINYTVQQISAGSQQQSQQYQRNPTRESGEGTESSTKKKGFFGRAVKALRTKNNTDLSNIEDMLLDLLDEMDDLRQAHERAFRGPDTGNITVQRPQIELNYNAQENEEGHPRRDSSSSQQVRKSYVHSKLDVRHDANNEDVANEVEGWSGGDHGRDRTPTQETHQKPHSGRPREQNVKHEPDSSPVKEKRGIFSRIPKIARWSKSNSNGHDDDDREQMTPESSHSGSNVNLLHSDAPYSPDSGDRLQSGNPPTRHDGVHEQYREASIGMDDSKFQSQHQLLTLQHPQPRPGPTHRHQTHLESQASGYGEVDPPMSPDSDTLGSVPSLARFPGGAIAGYGGNLTQSARPPERHQQQKALEQEYRPSHRAGPAHNSSKQSIKPHHLHGGPPDQLHEAHYYVRPAEQRTSASASSDSSSSPATAGVDPDEDEEGAWRHNIAVPLPRKRSPYSPGGLLAPIVERYSMEIERDWDAASWRSVRSSKGEEGHGNRKPRDSGKAAGGGTSPPDSAGGSRCDTIEEESDSSHDRSGTPRLSARAALGATGEPTRKLTGPREMPRSASGSSGRSGRDKSERSAGAGKSSPLRGTVRRKPMPVR